MNSCAGFTLRARRSADRSSRSLSSNVARDKQTHQNTSHLERCVIAVASEVLTRTPFHTVKRGASARENKQRPPEYSGGLCLFSRAGGRREEMKSSEESSPNLTPLRRSSRQRSSQRERNRRRFQRPRSDRGCTQGSAGSRCSRRSRRPKRRATRERCHRGGCPS